MLSTATLLALAMQCGVGVPTDTLMSVITTESGANPYVIANVTDGESYYLPSLQAATEKAVMLTRQKKNFSAGLMQINSKNFPAEHLDSRGVFDACANITAGAHILQQCYLDAVNSHRYSDTRSALQAALSCYYSGNFTRGLVAKGKEKVSYVASITQATVKNMKALNTAVPSTQQVLLDVPPGEQVAPSLSPAPRAYQPTFFITDAHEYTPEEQGEIQGNTPEDTLQAVLENARHKQPTAPNTHAPQQPAATAASPSTQNAPSWDVLQDYTPHSGVVTAPIHTP